MPTQADHFLSRLIVDHHENILQQMNQVEKYTDEWFRLKSEEIELRGYLGRQSLLAADTSNEGQDPLLCEVNGKNDADLALESPPNPPKPPQAVNIEDDRAALLARISALELENKLLREKTLNPLIQSTLSGSTDASGDGDTSMGMRIAMNGIRSVLNDAVDSDDVEQIAGERANGKEDLGDSTRMQSKGSVRFEDEGCTSFISNYEEKKPSLARTSVSGRDAATRDSNVCFSLSGCSRFKSFIDSGGEEFAIADSSDGRQTMFSQSLSAADLSDRSDLLDDEDFVNTHKRSVSSFDGVRPKSLTHSRAANLFTKLNVISHMLKKKPVRSFDGSAEQRQSFQQFFLLSVNTSVARNESDWVDAGSRFLDPVLLRYADCMDYYPRDVKDGTSTNELSIFCLLGGLKVRLIPRASCYQLETNRTNEYKVLAFTDSNGMTSHGVAITVLEEVDAASPGYDSFVKQVHHQQKRRLAARNIIGWWRRILNNRVDEEMIMISIGKVPDHSRSLDGILSGNSKSSPSTSLTKSSKSKFTIASKLKRITIGGTSKKKKASMPTLTKKSSESSDQLTRSSLWSSDQPARQGSGALQNSNHAIQLGKESYEMMEEGSKLGDICIVEKCYVMIGGEQSEQFLQFRSLQHLINMESKKRQSAAADEYSNGSSNGKAGTSKNTETNRHNFLGAVQTRLCLNAIQSRLTLPDTNYGIMTTADSTPTYFDINLPAFEWVDRNSIRLPLPQVSHHWGLSVLFQRLSPRALMSVLRLLLIERSIIIIGESSIVVSSCTCALLDLLRPYRWASTFMPLLPEEMLDFVHSPVPFITGFCVKDYSHAKRIECDPRVTEAVKDGLSVVNLLSGSFMLTQESGIRSMIQKCPTETLKLSLYKNRLKSLQGASSASFTAFLDHGVSTKELVTLSSVQRSIRNCMTSYAGDIAGSPDGWQHFSIYMGGEDDDFAFFPRLFAQPLREKMEAELQLKEMMSHSQLFVEFVAEKRRVWKSRQEMAGGEVGKFIAEWIYEQHTRRRLSCKD